MMKSIVKIPAGIKYLNQHIKHLPKDCLFDKGKVGCGGTTVALTDDVPYVVCVPFVSLAENKKEQYNDDIFYFKPGSTDEEVMAYVAKTKVPKIIVVYDSLPRLCEYIDPAYFNILIDELHLLFTQYSFRNEAAQGVLKYYQDFKEFCFMTATLIDDEFMLEELKHLPIVSAEWADVKIVEVESIHCKKQIKGVVAGVVKDFLNGTKQGNAYIFVNSVSFIKTMIKTCGLDDSNTRAIYSKGNCTKVGVTNGNTFDKPKKINFLTSTAFEGCDIYDKDAKTYVISDASNPHSLVDISTSLQQIAGRIRDTQYAGEVTHIHSSTRYTKGSYAEFKKASDASVIQTKANVEAYNNLPLSAKAGIKKLNNAYIDRLGDAFVFDPNRVKIDLYNYKVTRETYKLRITVYDAYDANNFNLVVNAQTQKVVRVDKLDETFQSTVLALTDLDIDNDFYQAAIYKYPFLEAAIEHLGFDGIARLKFNTTNIQVVLKKFLSVNDKTKVCMALKEQLMVDAFIPTPLLKKKLANIYKHLDIAKTAKAKDITDYYKVTGDKEVSLRIKGKPVRGYIPLMPKTIFN